MEFDKEIPMPKQPVRIIKGEFILDTFVRYRYMDIAGQIIVLDVHNTSGYPVPTELLYRNNKWVVYLPKNCRFFNQEVTIE